MVYTWISALPFYILTAMRRLIIYQDFKIWGYNLCHNETEMVPNFYIHTETHKVSVICSMLSTSTLRPTKFLSSVPCYPHPHWDPQSLCHLFHVIHIHTETHKVSVICSMLSTSTLRPTKSLSSVPCYPHPHWDPQSLCHLFHVIHIHTETHKVSVICSMLSLRSNQVDTDS